MTDGSRAPGEEVEMQVDEVMQRDVGWCGPTDDAAEACRITWDRYCGCVPVADSALIPIDVTTRSPHAVRADASVAPRSVDRAGSPPRARAE